MTISPASTPVAAPKTSGLAIASLVCGIAGLCTFGVASIAGLILGFVAFSKIKNSGGQMTGRGLAIAGIVISSVIMILVILGVLITLIVPIFAYGWGAHRAMPVAVAARDQAVGTQSMSNVRQLCMAAEMYSNENNGRFPAAEEWPQALEKFCGSKTVMADPSGPSGSRAYAMNAQVGGKPEGAVKSPGQTVLFFECNPGAPLAGGREFLPSRPHHGRGYVIGFCDGHVENVSPDDLGRLIWDPNSDGTK